MKKMNGNKYGKEGRRRVGGKNRAMRMQWKCGKGKEKKNESDITENSKVFYIFKIGKVWLFFDLIDVCLFYISIVPFSFFSHTTQLPPLLQHTLKRMQLVRAQV